MRLAPLLATLSDEELDRLAIEHVRTDERLPRMQLCNFLEGAIRSYRFINDFVFNRQPPTFAILTLLLDAPGYELQHDQLSQRALEATRRLSEQISSGDLLGRDSQLQLYRRALYEARRNDLDLNASEAAILAVLRRESSIAQVEHFLVEHHQDFREFWDKADAFEHEEKALRSAGLIFSFNDRTVIPEDVAPAILQTLGIDMPTEAARRLFEYLNGAEMVAVLEAASARTSGTREARIERILSERIQPRMALREVNLPTLREICRATEASVSGSKDELIERIISHFATGKDQVEELPVEPPIKEARRLDLRHFETMFSALLHQELADILRRQSHLRQTGTKDVRIRTLWESHLSEASLLGELMNRQLEDVLERLRLRFSGSKGARIERIIEHFEGLEPASTPHSEGPQLQFNESTQLTEPPQADVLENQVLFRQKASNPNASLQPWLDELLQGGGLIRCYATEDPNPTKQLKNKLSQAASARDGLLVLLLADEGPYLKAREALVDRWMSNAEWPKGVAAVALAHPISNPTIEAIVERVDGRWADPIRNRLFPAASVLRPIGDATGMPAMHADAVRCVQCDSPLPSGARFCPCCGSRADSGP